MDWFELTIRYLGIATLTTILLASTAAVALGAAVFAIRYMPRLHAGEPNNEGELCFYDYRRIITGKDDQRVEGERRMINAPLGIRWWFGISYRPAPKWFIGIIRWEPKQ